MNLIDCLSEVEDPRRRQGQRYSSVSLLLIIIMCILRGQYGYREIARFCKFNSAVLIAKFGFKNKKVPSHVSIRAFIMTADFPRSKKLFIDGAETMSTSMKANGSVSMVKVSALPWATILASTRTSSRCSACFAPEASKCCTWRNSRIKSPTREKPWRSCSRF